MTGHLRIIDANLNRLREGWRTLEDLSRFVLDEDALTARIKRARHASARLPDRACLRSRDSEGDVGSALSTDAEMRRADLVDVGAAACKRVQESLRVLEEMYKLIDQEAAAACKRLRFDAYDIEGELLARLAPLRRAVLPDPLLYVVLSLEHCRGRDPLALADAALRGGVGAVQLRAKAATDPERMTIGAELADRCRGAGALFFVNDRPDLALALDADGLHVGQEDLDPATARRLVGPGMILGLSCHSVEQLDGVPAGLVDYAGIGPVFETATKDDPDPTISRETLEDAARRPFPVVAIGGITTENAHRVVAAGCRRVAVISGLLGADDVEAAARGFCTVLGREVKERSI